MIQFPKMDEYQTAIQNPQRVFEDPELRNAVVTKNPLGLPKVSSGGFALTYQLKGSGKEWAVRCFHKNVENRQQRYAAISQFLNRNPQPIFESADYLPNGILVNGTRYPIIKMSWVAGITLSSFIERNIDNNLLAIKPLAEQFRDLISVLERLGIAHGDLEAI